MDDPRFTTDGNGNQMMKLDAALDVLADAPDYFVEGIRHIYRYGWVGANPLKTLYNKPHAACVANSVTRQVQGERGPTLADEHRSAVVSVLCAAAGVSAIGYLFLLNDEHEGKEGELWAKRLLARAHRMVADHREDMSDGQ